MGEEDTTIDGSYNNKQKGGFKASIFIFVLVAMESIGFVANMASLVLYFMFVMNFDISGAANTLTNFLGSTFLLTLVGGFISDTYLNRLTTCLCFGALEVVGFAMMTIQARYDNLHPKNCGEYSCVKGWIGVMFYASLSVLALASGGAKGSLPALGGDQFDQKDPKQAKALASFFNMLLLATVLGALVGVTGVVWISLNKGWYWGFFIATLTTFVGYVVLALGKPFYRLDAPTQSPLLRIVEVIVVAMKNRRLSLQESQNKLYEIEENGKVTQVERVTHTDQFKWLDKAAILPLDKPASPWNVCTVAQVEEVKILIRMLPILGSTIIMNTCLAQLQTFSVEQGNMMNLRLGHIKIPAPSLPVIPFLFMIILIPIYEFMFVPFARKITHHPSGITQLQRVGVGLVLSAISMAVAGLVEAKRRSKANNGSVLSVFWLAFQFGIFGIADMFTLVGLIEFFYKEAPAHMKSLSTSFAWLSLSLGYYVSSVLVSAVNAITRRITPSKQGWLHGGNINENNLNLFYWLLAVLSCLNIVNYVYWASWYKYKTEEPKRHDSVQEQSITQPDAMKQLRNVAIS